MKDLFDYIEQAEGYGQKAPLADRMRPRNLQDFYGQTHIVGEGKLLRRAIELDRVSSLILYGPPGTGKTTLAEVISRTTKAFFVRVHTVTAGVKELRSIADAANERNKIQQQKTVLFVDEIHRFNKAQQDVLLPFVENGTLILIGATTENPFFEVNAALLSRSMVFQLQELDELELMQVLEAALKDKERGLGQLDVEVNEDAKKHLIRCADGDARRLLNAIELAVATTNLNQDNIIIINLAIAEDSIQRRAVKYDKDGDRHYDTISAFIKSIRGSDANAAIYWLARMLDAGEDANFIARRLIILAAEDIGNADAHALPLAVATLQAVHFIGMPEARIILAQATTYLADAPKSNASYKAINMALADVQKYGYDNVPVHLRDASYKGAKQLGHGAGYVYPHDYPECCHQQKYLPEKLVNKIYYEKINANKDKTKE